MNQEHLRYNRSVDEFELIDVFLSAFQETGGSLQGGLVELGPGDDAAILTPSRRLVITTDAIVENVHFRREWTTPEQIGHKALAVNLSDISAMGARPETFTCALAFPASLDRTVLVGLARGMGRLAGRTGAVLSGGNFTRASELSITITALGSLETQPLRRDAARPGDAVLLVGEVGLAAAELSWLQSGGSLPEGTSALHEPTPLVAVGARAARYIRAGIDISDGLVQDLGHVARASGVRFVIDPKKIPRSTRFRGLTGTSDEKTSLRLLLSGGEDYALALIGSDEAIDRLRAEVGGVVIGRVERGSGVHVEGVPQDTVFFGHDHFRAS